MGREHLRHYLLGHHTIVLTDHSACTSLLNAARPSAKQARWAMIVQEFDLTVKQESVTPMQMHYLATLSLLVELRHVQLAEEQAKDREIAAVIHYVRDSKILENRILARRLMLEGPQCDMLDSVLHHKNSNQPGEWRIVVPGSLCTWQVLWPLHMEETLGKKYWWKSMCGDVERFCKSCLECVTMEGAW